MPRVAITKLVNRFHFKALYSHAFRAPGFENINLSSGIQPEHTQVLEAEAGYQLTDALFLSANVFDITLRDPIVYAFDEATGEEFYENATRTGTRGVEASLRFRRERAQASLSWSWYRAIGNQVEPYAVEGHPTLLLGFPAHKVTPVDTVGAGDTFVGYLAAGLEAGLELKAAMRRAAVAASLACLKPGAQPAIPMGDKVDWVMGE